MTASSTRVAAQATLPAAQAATPARPAPRAAVAVSAAQSSISSQAPATPNKGLLSKLGAWIVWFITGCGIFSSKTKPVRNSTNAQTAVAPTAAPISAATLALSASLEPMRQKLSAVERQVVTMAPLDTIDRASNARELRWQLQAIKAEIRPSNPAQTAQLFAKIESLDNQLIPFAGVAGQGTLDLSEIHEILELDSIDGNAELFDGYDDDTQIVSEATQTRDGKLFLAMAALDPKNPQHLPLREKILRCLPQMDEHIDDNVRVKVVNLAYAQDRLEGIETEAGTLARITDIEGRLEEITILRTNVMLFQRVVHPQDARHQTLRSILQRINTLLDGAEAPITILERANSAITAAEECVDSFSDNSIGFHEGKELRWRLYQVKHQLNATDPRHSTLLTRINSLDGRLKNLANVPGQPAVNVHLLQTKLFWLEACIDNFTSYYPERGEHVQEAGSLRDRELFMLNEALDPSEPAHWPLRDQVQRLYRKLDGIAGDIDRPTEITEHFASGVLVDLKARAEALDALPSGTLTESIKRELIDTLNIVTRSIHARDADHRDLREKVRELRAVLGLSANRYESNEL